MDRNKSIDEILDSAKNENLNITTEQARLLFGGRKVCGLFYCIRWDK